MIQERNEQAGQEVNSLRKNLEQFLAENKDLGVEALIDVMAQDFIVL